MNIVFSSQLDDDDDDDDDGDDDIYINQPAKVLFTNPSARAGYDTRSIFKRSLTGLNSEFSFS